MNIAIAIFVTIIVVTLLRNVIPRSRAISYALEHRHGVDDPQFAREMGELLGPPILGGNTITTLVNGDRIFPSMLQAIREARSTITLETFIYWSGAIGIAFTDALVERARAGVHVHLLLDWLGTRDMDQAYLDRLSDAGVQVVRYHPVTWYTLDRINNRTHRKLLVIDGRIGFTGGVGIADQWLGDAHDSEHWRDTHFRLEGPAVLQMQAAFLDNWLQTRGEVLQGPDYFPPAKQVGTTLAQLFKSSPRGGTESARLMYLMSFAAATRTICITSAYFIPDDLTVQELVRARGRGVAVEVLLAGPIIDTQVTRDASRSRWGPLLEAGVRIFEYMPTMLHSKVMVVDDMWASVGSTNLDNRSFRLNDEANLNILDAAFAAQQRLIFEADKAKSREVTLEMWRRRPLLTRLRERAAGLLRSQL